MVLDNTMDIPCRVMKLGPYFTPNTEIDSKWIIDLNIRTKL